MCNAKMPAAPSPAAPPPPGPTQMLRILKPSKARAQRRDSQLAGGGGDVLSQLRIPMATPGAQ